MLLKEQTKQIKQMNPIEQAELAKRLYDEGKDQKYIAERLEVSVPQISNLITLAQQPLKIKKRIIKDELAFTLVLEIIRDFPDLSKDALVEIIEKTISNAPRGHKITRKDFNKTIERFNSISIIKKIINQVNINDVKFFREEFEVMRGMILGKFDKPTLMKRYGLNK